MTGMSEQIDDIGIYNIRAKSRLFHARGAKTIQSGFRTEAKPRGENVLEIVLVSQA